MGGFEIAALVAMLAGTAMQHKASQDAAKRQEQATREALARQDVLQREAEKKAMDHASEFSTDKRQADQAQIEENLTKEFLEPVKSAQEINAAQATTQGNVSSDYTASQAQAKLNVAKNAEALARLLGKTTAAGRLRTNEAIRTADTAAGIDRLGNFARGNKAVDELAIQVAGRPNAGLMLGGEALKGLGYAGLAGGNDGVIGKWFGQSASATQPTADAVLSGMPLGSGFASTPTPTGFGAVDWTGATKPTGLGTGMWGINPPISSTGYKIPKILGGM